ncbi:ACBP4 [Symbiodinium microadriaticum]|nr:ACBP4 [Symbiodinium microadriaticum]
MRGQFCLFTVLCWLRGSAVDIDQCEEVSRPAGTGLLQAKSHLDPSRLQEVESESDLAILGESWQGALQLQELGANNSLNRLAAQCRKDKARKAKAQVPRVPLEVAQQLREVARADVIRVRDGDPCPGEITLWQFFHNETSTSCCPSNSTDCAGCAMFSAGKCQKCEDGYLRQNGTCVACLSTIDWVNEKGESCDRIKEEDCNDRPVNGQSSKQACCNCNGGHKSPTPFKYADKRFAVGVPIYLEPLPRTATRYSVNGECNLAAYNLTLDGSTGVISYQGSMAPPVKAFSVQCEVTAHEGVGLSETVKVSVTAEHMTYSSAVLVFSQKTSSYPVASSGTLQDFSMVCAPEQPWLSVDASGTVTASQASAQTVGGVTDAGEDYSGMDGGVCVVTATGSNSTTKRTATFAAIRPRPWPELVYESSYAEVVIGEQLPPLKLQTPKGYEEGRGGLKPTSFVISCTVGDPIWSYDRNWGVGLLQNHQILEVAPDGSIALAPGESMAQMFDEIPAYQAHRKNFQMRCGVYGLFPGTDFQPIFTQMIFNVKDSKCWVKEQIVGEVIWEEHTTEETHCRQFCRLSKVCSHFTFADDTCKHYRINNVDGTSVMTYAKVTDCTDLSTCIRLKHPEWVVAGDYCPVEYDIRRGGPVYRKDSLIPQEVMYLASVPSGSTAQCATGSWLVQRARPEADYVDTKLGYFELAGEEMLCLEPGVPSAKNTTDTTGQDFTISLDWATLACPQPLTHEVEDDVLHPLVFDDPTTLQPDDHWLHPCDCVPPGWGLGFPANALVAEGLPPASDGAFIPPPLLIVQGQFACPSRQLLPGKRGIYFETEAEAFEKADCQVDCAFYWTGTSHGAQTCRLFNGCDSLVREFGIDGDLYALPSNASCLVANPEHCWKTTMRRQFLTQTQSVSPSFTLSTGLFNQGGLADFQGNASRLLNREDTYEEKMGEISTVKLLGWTEIFKPFGYATLPPTALYAGSSRPEYEWSLLTRSNQRQVNHGPQMTLSQKESSQATAMKQGKSTSTPRGEMVFDFEASEFSLAPQADAGICAGAKMEPASNPRTCRAYGSREVSGWSSTGVSVRAHVRCMKMEYVRNLQVVTSSGASYSSSDAVLANTRNSRRAEGDKQGFLQGGAAAGDNFSQDAMEADEGDVDLEVSLDADGHAREEDEEAKELDLGDSEEADEADEAEVDDSDAEVDSEDESEPSEDPNAGVHLIHLMRFVELATEESQEVFHGQECLDSVAVFRKCCERILVPGHRLKSSKTVIPLQGTRLEAMYQYSSLKTVCYDKEREGAKAERVETASRRDRDACPVAGLGIEMFVQFPACNRGAGAGDAQTRPPQTLSAQTHVADGGVCVVSQREATLGKMVCGYAQALCGKLDDPDWEDRSAEGWYWSNKEDGTERFYRIKIFARCADVRSSSLILAGINLTRVVSSNLLQDVPAKTDSVAMSKSFRYVHLFQQCDALLLMGGIGVEHCARPAYREPGSHVWRGKRPLPSSFLHGTELNVACWQERYQSFRAGYRHATETLHCVNGDWYNSLQLPELTAFSCEPCVLVAGKGFNRGYTNYAKRNQQELYYFSRMALRVYTELGSLAATHGAAQTYCLMKGSGGTSAGGNMTLMAASGCPEILAMQVVGSAEVEDRMMALLDFGIPDSGFCLEAVPGSDGVSPSLAYKKCDLENAQQLISPMAVPGVMWDMHKESDRTLGEDFHKAYGSYCGAHGALASLAFGQVFGGKCRQKSARVLPLLPPLLPPPPTRRHLGAVVHVPVRASDQVRSFACREGSALGVQTSWVQGEWMDTAITYDKRSSDWPEWNTLLADFPVLCADGEALTGFKLLPARNIFRFECSRIGGLGQTFEYFSAQVEVKKFDQRRMIKVDCGADALLSGFHFEFSEGGRWARSKYTCSKAGGAPVVMEPSTTIESMTQAPEGIFCPLEPDAHTGRYKSPVSKLGMTWAGYVNALTGDTLSFERWCVGPDCSSPVGGADPVGVLMTMLEVLNVTNFDGHFEAKGVPSMDEGGMDDLAKKLKDFKAEMPKYADECLDYGELWNKLTETHINADKEEVVEESKLEPDVGTVDAELPDVHPCEIVQTTGFGIFGRLGEGDGKNSPPNLLYKARCPGTIVDLPFDISKQAVDLQVEIEGYKACNPYEAGFSRLFCDIHCVRDAVIRGDRTILRNLEEATKISNDNMRKMVEWSTEATRTETEYLDKKIDHSLKINTIYLHHIAKNTQPKEEELLQNAVTATGSMLAELKGFAEISSLGVSRVAAGDALTRFLSAAEPLVEGNATRTGQVQKFQSLMSDLYQTMRASTGGLTKAQAVGRQVAREAQQLQERTRRQAQVLGIYRAHSRDAHKAAKSWARLDAERTLVTLDKLWWRIRDRLDRYIDIAGAEITQLERSLATLAEYENCKAGTLNLLQSYSSGMKSMRRSRAQLRAVWRETSNLMGELAAIISDGDVFGSLMAAEGCKSALAAQTLDQIRFVLQDSGFLIHRFEAANLPQPDVSVSCLQAQETCYGPSMLSNFSCAETACALREYLRDIRITEKKSGATKMRVCAVSLRIVQRGADAPRSDSEGTEPPSDEEEGLFGCRSLQVKDEFVGSDGQEDSGLLLQERVSLGRFGTLALEPVLAKKEGPVLYAAFVEKSSAIKAVSKLDGMDLRSNAEKRAAAGCRRSGVYDPSEHLLGVQPLPHTQRRGSKPTLLGRKSEAPKVSDEGAADAEDAKEEVMTESTSSTTRRNVAAATPKRASRPGKPRGAAAALLAQASPRGPREVSPATGSTALPAPPSHSEDSVPLGSAQSVDSSSDAQVHRSPQPTQSRALCCGDGCLGGFRDLLRSSADKKPNAAGAESAPLRLPVGRSFQEQRESERRVRLAELNMRFAAAQEAAKGLLLSSDEKLQLYAYQKQAIEGPVFGNPPSALNATARSKRDAWAKLKCMDKDVAKQGYCALVDKFAPGWRSRAGVGV